MTDRRETMAALLAGASMLLVTGNAMAEEASEAEALKALDPWTDALFSGDSKKVSAVLGEEFQIVRSDGTGFDKATYLKNLPKQKKRSSYSQIHATRAGGLLVLRYFLDADQVINGKNAASVAPRLSVFRATGGGWLLVSHANFSALA